MLSLPSKAVLLIIDVQKGFDDASWGARNNPEAEGRIATLLSAWRRDGRPVMHVRHDSTSPTSPLRPGQPGHAFQDAVQPIEGEAVFSKRVNSAFIGTRLEAHLRARGLDTLIFVGLTTNHCISTTARMAGNLGFRTYVVSDATAAFARSDHEGQTFDAEVVHAVSLASLHGEFATVVPADAVLAAFGPFRDASAHLA